MCYYICGDDRTFFSVYADCKIKRCYINIVYYIIEYLKSKKKNGLPFQKRLVDE